MKKNKTVITALEQVLAWKESIYNDVKHLSVADALDKISRDAGLCARVNADRARVAESSPAYRTKKT